MDPRSESDTLGRISRRTAVLWSCPWAETTAGIRPLRRSSTRDVQTNFVGGLVQEFVDVVPRLGPVRTLATTSQGGFQNEAATTF